MDQETDRTLYGRIFHRNICWQRSYERVEGEEIVMALYGSLRDGLHNSRRLNLPNKSDFLGMTRIKGYALYSLVLTLLSTRRMTVLWLQKCAGFQENSSLRLQNPLIIWNFLAGTTGNMLTLKWSNRR